VFVGVCRESIHIGNAVQANLESDAEVKVWTQGVAVPGQTIQESLLEELHRSDFGIFVLTPDDVARIRNHTYEVVRDNVIWELGLFTGLLGRERVFMVVPRETPNLRIPNDLLGVTPAEYSHPEGTSSFSDLRAGLGPACSTLAEKIQQLGPFGRISFARHLSVREVLPEAPGLAGIWFSRFEFETAASGADLRGVQYGIEVLRKAGPRAVVGYNLFPCSSQGDPYTHNVCAEIFGRQVIGIWNNRNSTNVGALHLSLNNKGTEMTGMHLGNATDNSVHHGKWEWLRVDGQERDLRDRSAPTFDALDKHFKEWYSRGKHIPLDQLFGS
jgi:hypothetical protein